MPESFTWILGPHHEYLTITSDEFVIEQFRLQLAGNSLKVEVEQSESGNFHAQARQLAEQYIKLLSKYVPLAVRLITIEEFASMPAQSITVRSPNRQEITIIREAIRKARNELLASGDPTLRQCYDYIEDAREHDLESLFFLYKVIDTIENKFGGEKKASEVLKIREELKFVKRLANEPLRDERHAPKPSDVIQRPSGAECARAMEYTISVIRAYEQHLRSI